MEPFPSSDSYQSSPPVEFGEVVTYVEAEAGPLLLILLAVHLAEFLEQHGALVCRDAHTEILHGEDEAVQLVHGIDHRCTRLGEFHRIVHQPAQDVLYMRRMHQHGDGPVRHTVLDGHLIIPCLEHQVFNRRSTMWNGVMRESFTSISRWNLPRFDLRHCQEIVHHRIELLLLSQHLQELGQLLLGIIVLTLGEHLRGAEDGGERRPHLVRDQPEDRS